MHLSFVVIKLNYSASNIELCDSLKLLSLLAFTGWGGTSQFSASITAIIAACLWVRKSFGSSVS